MKSMEIKELSMIVFLQSAHGLAFLERLKRENSTSILLDLDGKILKKFGDTSTFDDSDPVGQGVS